MSLRWMHIRSHSTICPWSSLDDHAQRSGSRKVSMSVLWAYVDSRSSSCPPRFPVRSVLSRFAHSSDSCLITILPCSVPQLLTSLSQLRPQSQVYDHTLSDIRSLNSADSLSQSIPSCQLEYQHFICRGSARYVTPRSVEVHSS